MTDIFMPIHVYVDIFVFGFQSSLFTTSCLILAWNFCLISDGFSSLYTIDSIMHVSKQAEA